MITEGVKAKYKEARVLQYQGNPLIEALPQRKSQLETIIELSIVAQWPVNIDLLDMESKIYALDSIQNIFQPIPRTIELKESVDRLIRVGYVNRNPLLRYNDVSQTPSIAVIGISGIGKSTAMNRVLSTYDQVIYHDNYNNLALNRTQIVWLKLNIPFDGSLKSLLYEFYSEIDRLIDTNYFERFIKNRATTDVMLQAIFRVSQSCCLGLIVIDEIQHLENVSNKNRMMIMNFFVNLTNTVGVPLIYVSTPSGIGVLTHEFRQARRLVSAIDSYIWDKHGNDDSWELLVKSLMRYQITAEKTECDAMILNAFHSASGGIVDILKKLHISSQILAMKKGINKVNAVVIKESARKSLRLIEPMMKSIESQNPFETFIYRDINIPEALKIENKKHCIPNTLIVKEKTIKTVKEYSKPDDFRHIVKEGGLMNKSAYISLKDAGYICENDYLLFGGES